MNKHCSEPASALKEEIRRKYNKFAPWYGKTAAERVCVGIFHLLETCPVGYARGHI